MKRLKQTIILAIFVFFNTCFLTCIGQTNIDSIIFIKYGTSFGECGGYCYHETKYNSSMITFYSRSWQAPDKDKFDTLKIDRNRWNKIVRTVNLTEFYNLPKSIGCPDCTDGGAEWIEIGTRTKTYKVEFEYRANIDTIAELLKLLRLDD